MLEYSDDFKEMHPEPNNDNTTESKELKEEDNGDEDGAVRAVAPLQPKRLLDPLFVKILERKIEILQWEMFDYFQSGSDNVRVNLNSKKDQFYVKVPICGKLCMPFAGSISAAQPTSTNKNQRSLFCTFLGMHFYVQSKAVDLQQADLLIPAWTMKTVPKQQDCFFVQEPVECSFVALATPNDELMNMSLRLVTKENEVDIRALCKQCTASGGRECFLSLIECRFFTCPRCQRFLSMHVFSNDNLC